MDSEAPSLRTRGMSHFAEQGIVKQAIVENEHHKLIHFTSGRRPGVSRDTRRACRR